MFDLSLQFTSMGGTLSSPLRYWYTGRNLFESTGVFQTRSVAQINSEVKRADLSVKEAAESPVFEPIVKDWKSLLESCDTISKRYMLTSQKNNPVRPDQIPREIHGVCHSNRTAMWAIVLLGLLRTRGNTEACQFTADEVNALIKSALMHDAGREGEGEDQPEWERCSGDLCGQHLLAVGYDMELASLSRNAIIHKNDERTEKSLPKTLFESLLHDADCLEVMRVRNEYDIKRLDLYDLLGEAQCYQLACIVREVIAEQGDLRASVEIIDGRKPCDVEQNKLGKTRFDQHEDSDKKSYEYAVSPLFKQLFFLQEKYSDLFLYVKNILGEMPDDILNDQHLYLRILNQLSGHRKDRKACFDSIYQDSVTGISFHLTDCGSHIAAARNQILMSRLASMLGLNVPECHIITSANDSILATEISPVASEPAKLTHSEKARLLVVCAWLGHNSIREEDLFATANASTIISGWQRSGEFNGLAIKQFDENIAELSLFLAIPLFRGMNRSDIVHAVKELCESESIRSIGELVETFGPDGIAHRHRLRRTLYQRLSSLNFYYSESVEVGHLSKAEEATINACGHKGQSIVFNFQDIAGGEILFYQYLDQEKNTITACELKLNSDAGYRVSERFGLNDQIYHDLQEAIQFFTILAGCNLDGAFNRSILTQVIKSEAALQAQRIEQLTSRLNDMNQTGQILEREEGAFSTWIDILESIKSIYQLVVNSSLGAHAIVNIEVHKGDKYKRVFTMDIEGHKKKIIVPSFIFISELCSQFTVQLFILDSRISLISNENKAESDYLKNNITTKNQYGYGFRKLAVNSDCNNERLKLPHLSCAANALLERDNKDWDSGQIKAHWFPYNYECQAMTNTLILTAPARAQTYQSLLKCVQLLGGIDIHRPTPQAIQEEYLQHISHMPYYKSMDVYNAINWMENHCRFNGQLRFYHPKESLAENTLKVRLMHALDYQFKNSKYYQGFAGRRRQALDKMINTESLFSAVERYRIGVSEGEWNCGDIYNGGGQMCYAAFYSDDPEEVPGYAMVMKPSVLRRTDLTIFNVNCNGVFNKQLIRLSSANYSDSNILNLVVRQDGENKKSESTQKHLPMEVEHEVLLAKSISFNEVENVILPDDAADYYVKNPSFISDMENWSDARPMDEVMPIKELTLQEKKQVDLYNNSVAAYLGVENNMGLDEFKEYVAKGVKYDFTPEWVNDVYSVMALFGLSVSEPLLSHTLKHQRVDLFEYLLSLPDTSLYLECPYAYSPIVRIIHSNNSRALELVLEKSHDIIQHYMNPCGFKSIMAIALDWPKMLKVILSHKSISPDVPFTTSFNSPTTPLLYCIEGDGCSEEVHYQSAKILLENHANPNLKASEKRLKWNNGNPPVIEALIANKFKLLKLLIDYGADVHMTNDEGESLISMLVDRDPAEDGLNLIEVLGLTEQCQLYQERSVPLNVIDNNPRERQESDF